MADDKLRWLSTSDLEALDAGDITKVSDQGLRLLEGGGKGGSFATNVLMGGLRGAKDVIDTGAQLLSSGFDKLTGSSEGARVRAMNEAGQRDFQADYGASTAAGVGRMGGQVVATLPIGGFAGAGVGAAGRAAGVPLLDALGSAIASGGMRTGTAGAAPANLAIRAGGGAIGGGLQAGAVNPGDAGLGAAIGGALPPAVRLAGLGGNAVRQGIVGTVSPETAQLAARAKELGISIPADRLTDSKPLNALAASLNYVPFSGRSASENRMTNGLNQALSRTFGQDSPNVTQALRKAEGDLGAKFDATLKNNNVRIDAQFMNDLAKAGNQASEELTGEGAAIINKRIDDILAKGADGEIDGRAAYNIKRTLDRIGRRNSPEGWYANDLKKDLMGALNRSLGPQQAAEFATVRQQYGNMLDLRKLAPNGADGEISAARLANMKNIGNPQVQELADISAQFVRGREGAHGAAQRVTLGGLGALSGLLGLPGAVPGAVAGIAGGRIGNTLLDSQLARNFILSGPQQSVPQAGLLGLTAARSAPLLGVGLTSP